MGRKSITDAKGILAQHSLSFGSKLANWDSVSAVKERQRLGRSLLRRLAERNGIASRQNECIEDELQSLISAVETGRNVPLLNSLYGFDGSEPKTLEAVGQVYGLTRERVRQLGDRAKNRLSVRWHDTPHLTAALECIRQVAPAGRLTISGELKRRGISRGNFSPEAVLEAVGLMGGESDLRRFAIGSETLYGLSATRSLVRLCVLNLRKATSSGGCTSIERLALQANLPINDASKVRIILEALSETKWLDDSRNWVFSTRASRNRLTNCASKVFSAAKTVEIGELRRCLSRPHRVQYVPPAEALSRLLEMKGVARRVGDVMVREAGNGSVQLSGIEKILLDGFEALGSPLSRERLEEYCIDQRGLNPTSFYIYLSYSPIVSKLIPGVYALVGAEVPVGSTESIQTAQLAARVSSEHGWTINGKLWLILPLDRLSITAASRTVPVYVAELTSGHWDCELVGGLSAGELTIENGFLAGLRNPFLLLAPEPGDFLRLEFNLQTRVVLAAVGGLELKDSAQERSVEGLEEDDQDYEQDDADLGDLEVDE